MRCPRAWNRPVPTPFQWRQLYRALLRETSYLPDSAARSYFRGYISRRFHKAVAKVIKAKVSEERLLALCDQGEKKLRKLIQANNGDHESLRSILFACYGRTLRRRRELLVDMRLVNEPEQPSDRLDVAVTGTLAAKEEVNRISKTKDEARISKLQFSPKLAWPNDKLRALVRNQASRRSTSGKRNIGPTLLDFKIPVKNAQGRSMPVKRQKNMVKKYYGTLLERVQPPLPAEDWLRLQRLVEGELQEPVPPLRTSSHSSNLGYFVNKAAIHTEDATPPQDIRAYLGGPLPNWQHLRRRYPRPIRPRKMQRLWGDVFSNCPMMELKGSSWQVRWGYTKPMRTRQVRSVYSDISELFNHPVQRQTVFASPARRDTVYRDKSLPTRGVDQNKFWQTAWASVQRCRRFVSLLWNFFSR